MQRKPLEEWTAFLLRKAITRELSQDSYCNRPPADLCSIRMQPEGTGTTFAFGRAKLTRAEQSKVEG